MMILILLIALGGLLSNALPSSKRSAPCPYHNESSESGSLLKDEYIVNFEPGYTLEEHYGFVGYDVSSKAEKFHFMPHLDMYSVTIDEKTMHEIIRYDPGVIQVSHSRDLSSLASPNLRFEPSFDAPEDETLQKRWSVLGGKHHWSTAYLNNWNTMDHLKLDDFESQILWEAGRGADVYVMDGGFNEEHEVFHSHGKYQFFGKFRYLKDGKRYTNDPVNAGATHGTGVAGLVATNAPWATVVGVKVFGNGSSTARWVEAFNDIIDDHKKFQRDNPYGYKGALISISLQTTAPEKEFESAIKKSFEAGLVVVAGAGNDGNERVFKPCIFENVICVGAIAHDYHKTQFSNYGKDVDLYAPGDKITIADSEHKNDYVIAGGTSLATPMVSAILATYISYEHITKNASKVVERLKQNWHEDFLQYATPNIFVHSGLQHPARKRGCPYNGYPGPCDAVENTKKMNRVLADTRTHVDVYGPHEEGDLIDMPLLDFASGT